MTRSWLPGSSLRHQKAPSGGETALVNAALIFLRTQGAFAFRNNTGAMTVRTPGQRSRFIRFGVVGSSDILGCFEGRMICVECKRPGNHPTWAQTEFLRTVQQHGGWAVWVTSVTELEQRWEETFGVTGGGR